MIQLTGIRKSLGGKLIVERCTLCVDAGHALCLCGPSGLGKTTLLEMAAGLTRPDSGTVRLGSKRLGCVFQDDALVPWQSALENILMVLRPGTPRPKRVAGDWLCRFDLDPDLAPTRMSGGMRRRLSLARAFAVNPDILFLDEPFAFLDAAWQERTARLMEEQRTAGAAVLMVSHQMEPMAGMDCESLLLGSSPLIVDTGRCQHREVGLRPCHENDFHNHINPVANPGP